MPAPEGDTRTATTPASAGERVSVLMLCARVHCLREHAADPIFSLEVELER